MKRINYGDVNYLVGDTVADTLVRYTVLLAATGDADVVEVNVLGPDGNPETATFALGPGILITAETTRSELGEPDNEAVVTYMRGRADKFLEGTQQSISRDTIAEFRTELPD